MTNEVAVGGGEEPADRPGCHPTDEPGEGGMRR